MSFSKHAKLATTLLASAFVLTACGGGDTGTTDTATDPEVADTTADTTGATDPGTTFGDLEDGTYELVEQNFDENGWKAEMILTVENGEITESDYNEYNEDGMPKTEDDEYQAMMAEQQDVGPQDYVPALNDQLVETQDPSQVDVVSGATSSSEKFQEYASMLMNAAETGSTETIEVAN